MLIPRSALTTTFEREKVVRRRSVWRVIPERCRAANDGGVGGRRHHCPSPLEDGSFCKVLVGFNLHDPFVLLKRAGVGEARTAARGTATMGAKGAGEGTTWAEMGTKGAEAPARSSAPWQWARELASLALFSSFSTMPAPKQEGMRRQYSPKARDQYIHKREEADNNRQT